MNVALRPEHLNILSICTGGAGLDLGIELAVPGARTVCMVEREAFAGAQLVSAMEAGLMAPAPIWSDAGTFDGRQWRGAVDGLIGGIPCQPHSLAGKRLGEEDERDLWSTARRIIVQSGAWFVLIENVRGMLSSGGAERVWRDLRRLGFAVEGGLFTAAEVGASHERERFFILAVADTNRRQCSGRSAITGEAAGGWPHLEPAGSGARVPFVSLADAVCERGCSRNSGWQDAKDAHRSGERGVIDNRSALDIYNEFQLYGTMEHTPGERRGEGWPKPELRSGRDTVTSADSSMADASGTERREIECDRGSIINREESRRQQGAGRSELCSDETLFPPGPTDIDGWQTVLERAPELEPAFRRVADGLATRLDIARVDRLRMLGNGVVPLEAAYAFRTLATRLAASGSAGATHIVRMMETA